MRCASAFPQASSSRCCREAIAVTRATVEPIPQPYVRPRFYYGWVALAPACVALLAVAALVVHIPSGAAAAAMTP